jgi:hypothetical protein
VSRNPHKPTKESRQLVQLHATVGTRQDTIASILEIDPKTLRKYYKAELEQANAKANATIGGALFNKAKDGDTAAMIFWMKTQARWSERHEVDHSSSDGTMMPDTIIIRAAEDIHIDEADDEERLH